MVLSKLGLKRCLPSFPIPTTLGYRKEPLQYGGEACSTLPFLIDPFSRFATNVLITEHLCFMLDLRKQLNEDKTAMAICERIKRFLSLVILACFFLPLCQCTAKAPLSENQLRQVAISKSDTFTPATAIELKNLDEIPLILVFAWPLAAIFIRLLPGPKTAILSTNIVELLLSLASIIYIVNVIRYWGTIKFGGIIYLAAIASYSVVCGYILVINCQRLLCKTSSIE